MEILDSTADIIALQVSDRKFILQPLPKLFCSYFSSPFLPSPLSSLSSFLLSSLLPPSSHSPPLPSPPPHVSMYLLTSLYSHFLLPPISPSWYHSPLLLPPLPFLSLHMQPFFPRVFSSSFFPGGGDGPVLCLLPPGAEPTRVRWVLQPQVSSQNNGRARQKVCGWLCHLLPQVKVSYHHYTTR